MIYVSSGTHSDFQLREGLPERRDMSADLLACTTRGSLSTVARIEGMGDQRKLDSMARTAVSGSTVRLDDPGYVGRTSRAVLQDDKEA